MLPLIKGPVLTLSWLAAALHGQLKVFYKRLSS